MNAAEVVHKVRTAFQSGRTKSLDFREKQLEALLQMYQDNKLQMFEALNKDLHKSKQESFITEIDYLINDVKSTLASFRKWAKPDKPKKGLVNALDELQIIKEPYGVVLIIGAWNYPLQLSLLPLSGAIAAGNCVVVKPSEISEHCARFVEETLPKYLDDECYHVVCGGPSETTELLQERFDYIFYTGSTSIGKVVHAAANKYLTPVTLELGGKSPVFLDESADIEVAAKRILWGKCVNAGQTCVAPDYLLCTKETERKFVEQARKFLVEWYGKEPKDSPDLCRIVNDRHYKRIENLLHGTNRIAIGGKRDAQERFIEPTVVIDVKPTDPLMQEEIFGPVLPILNVKNVVEAIQFINAREKPLSLYVFSKERPTIDLFLSHVSAGGVCVNDTLMHLAVESLPFGGVGNSGMGAYHGKASFDTFVHKKSTLIKNLGKVGEKLSSSRYPPYSESKLNYLRRMLAHRASFSFKFVPYVLVFGLGVLAMWFARCLADSM